MIRVSAALALLASIPFCAPAASASTVVIWPVDPVIEAKQQATALWLENKGAAPVTLQIRTLGWSQANGSDVLASDDAVVASPPIAAVAPGQRQLVRLIRRNPTVSAGEHSYRLLIDELPAPPTATPQSASNAELSVQMRYSIPLFAYGAEAAVAEPALSTRIGVGDGGRFLEIINKGDRHARLTDLKLGEGPTAVLLRAGLAGYVLPGGMMRWALPAGVNGTTVNVGVNGVQQALLPTS